MACLTIKLARRHDEPVFCSGRAVFDKPIGASRLFAYSLAFFTVFLPISGRCTPENRSSFSVGLSDYNPDLEDVRDKLQATGGGKLRAMDEHIGKTVFFSLSTFRSNGSQGGLTTAKEVSYLRYRTQSGPADFLLELDRFSGSLLRYFAASQQSGWRAYWGGGVSLIRMKREGEVEERGSPLTTKKDWLWGLNGSLGLTYLVSDHVAMDTRYTRDLLGNSKFNGLEYSLGGGTFSYALAFLM